MRFLACCTHVVALLGFILGGCETDTFQLDPEQVCDDLEVLLTSCGLEAERDECLSAPAEADAVLDFTCEELQGTASSEVTRFFREGGPLCDDQSSERCQNWIALWHSTGWRDALPNSNACLDQLATCERWVYDPGGRPDTVLLGCENRRRGDVYCDYLVKSCLADQNNSGVRRGILGDGRPNFDQLACGIEWLFNHREIPGPQLGPLQCALGAGSWRAIADFRLPGMTSDQCTVAPDGIFAPCCQQHDVDWLTCGETFRGSNNRFRECMRDQCFIHHDGGDFMGRMRRSVCLELADAYFAGVNTSSTRPYFNTTQRAACYCHIDEVEPGPEPHPPWDNPPRESDGESCRHSIHNTLFEHRGCTASFQCCDGDWVSRDGGGTCGGCTCVDDWAENGCQSEGTARGCDHRFGGFYRHAGCSRSYQCCDGDWGEQGSCGSCACVEESGEDGC